MSVCDLCKNGIDKWANHTCKNDTCGQEFRLCIECEKTYLEKVCPPSMCKRWSVSCQYWKAPPPGGKTKTFAGKAPPRLRSPTKK